MFADPDYLKIIVTVVLAMLGWVTAHWSTSRRNRAAKQVADAKALADEIVEEPNFELKAEQWWRWLGIALS